MSAASTAGLKHTTSITRAHPVQEAVGASSWDTFRLVRSLGHDTLRQLSGMTAFLGCSVLYPSRPDCVNRHGAGGAHP